MHVEETGVAKFIYSDELSDALKNLGEVRIQRASHVEPNASGKWTADMSPMGGPVLGPFGTRSKALKEEVKWLENHLKTN